MVVSSAMQLSPRAHAAVVGAFTRDGREPVAPGVTHEWGAVPTGTAGRQVVHVVEIDSLDPAITFEASLSNDTVVGLETPSAQARRQSTDGHRAVAAINGDLWSGWTSSVLHAPHGLHIHAGELVVAGSTARPTFGIGTDGRPLIGTPRAVAAVTRSDGATLAARRINQDRRPGQLTVYTPRFGARTGTDASGTEVVLSGVGLPLAPTGTHDAVVERVSTGGGDTLLEPGRIVLSASGAAAPFLDALVPGERVTLSLSITPGWEHVREAVGGREMLVRDGAVQIAPFEVGFADVAHPRSSIGVTAEGRVVMATVDGRQSGYSIGMRLDELAEVMIARGAVVAMTLDGGGSTGLSVRRPGQRDVSVVNRPSDGQERPVTNSIVAYSSAPVGALAGLVLGPAYLRVPRGASALLVPRAVDAALNPVPMPPGPVTWSVEGSAGTVDTSGRFRAGATGRATVRAEVGGVSGSTEIEVVPDAIAPRVSAPGAELLVGSALGASTVPVRLTWTGADDETGVSGFALQQSIDGGAWTGASLSAPATAASTRLLAPSRTYRFRSRSVDHAGNVSGWAAGGQFRVTASQEVNRGITYSGTWARVSSSGAYGGSVSHASKAGATATFTFTGSQVAWVAPIGPTRGRASVLIDGVHVATVDLHRPSLASRRIVFTHAWPSSGRHSLQIQVHATKGRPRVDVDAFVVLNSLAAPTPSPTPPPTPTPTPPASPSPTPSPSEPPATPSPSEPPATEAPATEAPATEAPTEPPATEAPTEPPPTEPPPTEPPPTDTPATTPSPDLPAPTAGEASPPT